MDRMKRYQITTLGCKVNQCESAAIAASLAGCGLAEGSGGDAVDLIVVNTCAVTARAAMQSRQTIRQAVRHHPEALVVATGCYAQIDPETLRAIAGVGLVVGHDFKLDVGAWLAVSARDRSTAPGLLWRANRGQRGFDPLSSAAGEHRTRAFLKIQDGCNTRCSYCVVPLARGPSRSMPVQDVIGHLNQLGRQGFQEVVLTGIHLGAYGADLSPQVHLYALIAKLTALAPVARLRLSSIEPTEIDPRLIDLMAYAASGRMAYAASGRMACAAGGRMADPTGGLCHHLHIPLQSGDDTILKRMGRPYTRAHFAQTVQDIHRALPRAAIGVDVLVGFPGEDENAFNNTFHLIDALPIAYLHVFPYSARPGTVAAGFPDKVPSPVIKARCQRLRRLGEQKRARFYEAQIGTRTVVLIETAHDPASGLALGTSDNYIPVALEGADLKENTLATVELLRASPAGPVFARIV
jgi:threonylcarbamoyladenosine tRNA methylthiotransferase MtaB